METKQVSTPISVGEGFLHNGEFRSFEECPKENGVQIVRNGEVVSSMDNSDSKCSKISNQIDKPISAEELNSLRDTDILHHSNMFRLQMEELMKEITLKKKQSVKIKKWKESFSNFLKSMKRSKQYQLKNYDWIKEEHLPIPLPMWDSWPEVLGAFEFFPPEDVVFVGSFATQLVTTNSPVLDIALVLPKEFMQHNDLMNCRWLLRRVLYLSWLGKALLNNSELISKVSWTYHCGSHLRPVLKITPSGKLGEKWTINVFPVPPRDFFKLSHISPLRGSVSSPWFLKVQKQQGVTHSPTPNYNWACGVDIVMLQHNKFIMENLYQPNWIEGIKLLNLWLSQRYLNHGEGGISSHVMSLLVIYLIHNRKINLQMSPYQIFRTVLLYLIQTDWKSNGPTLATTFSSKDRNEVPLKPEDFYEHYSLSFIDPTGYLNLLAPTFHQTILEIQHEAKKALHMLELSFASCFEALFIQKVEFYLNYDQIIKINLGDKKISAMFDGLENKEELILDYVGDKRLPVFNSIISLLSRAFEGRLDLFGVLKKNPALWGFYDELPQLRKSLTLGLVINPSNGYSLMTKGPSADSTEAQAFREFWGEICEMRRFQDSTFLEAVLWGEAGDPIGDRRLIPGKIATHILDRHLHLPASKITYIAGQLEKMISLPINQSSMKYGTGEEVNSMAIVAFDKLSKKLRELDLPIQIATVQSTSEVLKHSHVFPPVAKPAIMNENENGGSDFVPLEKNDHGCPLYRFSIDVQIFLELSGKWPDELNAIQAMKVEFYCKIAELLQNDGITAIVFPRFVQVLWEGYVFRIKICYRREIDLLRLVNKNDPDDEGEEIETEEAIKLEKEIEILPHLTSFINSIQSDHPSFSGSVRLIRRWASAQLLMPHLPSIVLELLVANLFINSPPFAAPNTPHVALLRFLHFMATCDFHATPVIVNFGKTLSDKDIREILKRFGSMRNNYPPLFLCSPCELRLTTEDSAKRYKLLSCFTKSSPTVTILSRIKSVASSALEFYTKNMYSKNTDFKILFTPPLEDYDVAIYLKRKELARRMENLNSKLLVTVKPHKQIAGELMPPVDFDPAQCYLRELREGYGQHALFFHDEHGGNFIGVVWKPQALTPKPAKVNSLNGHMISGLKEIIQVANLEAFIEDFKIIGKGLVEQIIRKDSKT